MIRRGNFVVTDMTAVLRWLRQEFTHGLPLAQTHSLLSRTVPAFNLERALEEEDVSVMSNLGGLALSWLHRLGR
jgi:hypothetical protein